MRDVRRAAVLAVPEAYLSSGKYKLVEAVRVRVGVSRGAKRRVMYRLKEGLFG